MFYRPLGPMVLKTKHWKPVRLGNYQIISLLLGSVNARHLPLFQKSLQNIRCLLKEVHDYIIYPPVKKLEKQQ